MKKFLILAIVIALGWYGNARYKQSRHEATYAESKGEETQTLESNTGQFQCDGRTYCSQMTSCAEAKYFIQHCPDTKMDGNNDGVPCEKQWCR
ncbi:excalibur calcium-binding domain-containing protein [Hydrocarboniphaga sp.]|uniref:excalibur calcium-binding domain-containing protein n=1 Tax=Hydrocarboniphaga sp. TaxID=2033016 RepID=UPI0026353920|nr:excalibur calcium-binding domain-containing protein [Hydrocarboniphaga sp.]